MNIYAPNHESARTGFWTHLVDGLLEVDAWCVGGDFNMIESHQDRSGAAKSLYMALSWQYGRGYVCV